MIKNCNHTVTAAAIAIMLLVSFMVMAQQESRVQVGMNSLSSDLDKFALAEDVECYLSVNCNSERLGPMENAAACSSKGGKSMEQSGYCIKLPQSSLN